MPKEMKMYYNIVESDDSVVDVYVYGDITSWPWLDSDVSSYRLANKIAAIPADKHINVRVNSYGGEVAEGLAIYNVLKNRPVTTYCDGFAASAASIVFAAGKKRVMNKSSLLFIHNAIGYYRGNAKDLEKGAEDLKKMNEVIRNAYIESGVTLSSEELEALMDKEEWILPEDAVANGFATEIAEEDDDDDESISNILSNIQNRIMGREVLETTVEDVKVSEDFLNQIVDGVVEKLKNQLTPILDDSKEISPTNIQEKAKNGFFGFRK